MSSMFASKNRGFTFVELMVVVAIVGVLSAIVIVSANQARANSRDKQRITDIKHLQLTFRLYSESHSGTYPSDQSYANGVELGSDGGIAEQLNSLLPAVPKDPKSNTTYRYVYDTDFDCSAVGQTVLYVKTFETISSNANAASLCTLGTNDSTGTEHIIILE